MNYIWKILCSVILILLVTPEQGLADTDIDVKRTKVVIRSIGDQLLKISGDSTSRVLEVRESSGRYTLNFESPFCFDPESLAATIDKKMKSAQPNVPYLVEVIQCRTRNVVYSYEINQYITPDAIACNGRTQPTDCYEVQISLLDQKDVVSPITLPTISRKQEKGSNYWPLSALLVPIFGFFIYSNRKSNKDDSHIIPIGEYRFNQNSLTLSYKEDVQELTTKESELLLLFQKSINQTLTREELLKKVWGDEGANYIGRTIDVNISKLRKKLSHDPSIKIINIRGVGYKLVLDQGA